MPDPGAAATSCPGLISARRSLCPDAGMALCGGQRQGTSPRGRLNVHLLLMTPLLVTGFKINTEGLHLYFAQLMFPH